MSFTAAQLGLAVPLRGKRVDFLEFTLPWPPSVNHYWRHVGAKVLISKPGRLYRDAVAIHLVRSGHLEGRLFAQIDVYPPDRRERDLDNLCKSLFDSMQACGTFANDSQFDEIRLSRREIREGGAVRCVLWEMSQEEIEWTPS